MQHGRHDHQTRQEATLMAFLAYVGHINTQIRLQFDASSRSKVLV